MNPEFERIYLRQAFSRPVPMPLKVTPEGFLMKGKPPVIEEIQGRIVKTTFQRKLFREGALRCYSPDGLRARDGTWCQECLHPECRPQLRVHLHSPTFLFLLDLSSRSAKNFLQLQDEVEEEGRVLIDWILRLRVLNHGHWGEVQFERLRAAGGGSS
jgi:hypothetical protein